MTKQLASLDHYKNGRFFNPGVAPQRFSQLLKWITHQRVGPWRRFTASTPDEKPPVTVDGNALRVTFVNHATVLLQTEGCNFITTVQQQDFVDQGGTVQPRQRFAGGAITTPNRLYGSLKAVDPTTGEVKARLRLDYPNYSGALATAGNLVFIGEPDGTLSAHDAKTLQEVWSFNTGTGINAPPVTYSVGGKQYIAVLDGSKQSAAIIANAPELKNTSTASMLYVFGL